MNYSLTELQLAILDVLWRRGEATVVEVHEELRAGRRVAQSTVATLLSRLEDKGLIDHRKDGRQYRYRAVVSEEEVQRSVVSEFSELTEPLFTDDVAGLVSRLLDARDVEPDELARARELIRQKERALRRKEKS